jgi:hypothetical protein
MLVLVVPFNVESAWVLSPFWVRPDYIESKSFREATSHSPSLAGLRAIRPGVHRVPVRLDFILWVFSSRVPSTNNERTSPLIYPADPSGLRIERDQVLSWTRPRFLWNPRLLIVVHRGCGWKKLSRVWVASYCKPIPSIIYHCYCSYLICWRNRFSPVEIISYYISCEFYARSITFGYRTQHFYPLLRKLLVVDLGPEYYIY